VGVVTVLSVLPWIARGGELGSSISAFPFGGCWSSGVGGGGGVGGVSRILGFLRRSRGGASVGASTDEGCFPSPFDPLLAPSERAVLCSLFCGSISYGPPVRPVRFRQCAKSGDRKSTRLNSSHT